MRDRAGKDAAAGTGAAGSAGHPADGFSAHDALVHRKMLQRKAARQHHEAPPRHPDVAPDSVNPDHPSFDAARLGHVGHALSIRAGAIAYDGMGNPLSGPLPATPLVTDAKAHANRTAIMAGAMTEIVIRPPAAAPAAGSARVAMPAPERERCVFVWELPGSKDGWVPVSDIETPGDEAHPALDGHAQHAVEVDQDRIAHRIRERQGGDGGRHEERPLRALASAEIAARTTEGGKLLYICEQFNPVENRAEYFFGGAEIPLLLNCPTNDKGKPGGTWGVKDDLLPAGTRFVVDRAVALESIHLYLHASPRPVPGKKLTFVYGYVVNDAGERRHGWVNEAQLGPPERGGRRSKKK